MTTPQSEAGFVEQLNEIIQSIEVKSAIAIQKSMQDGDAKHHEEFVAQSRRVILDLIEREVIGSDEPQLTDDDEIASMPYKARVHEVSEKEYKENRNDLRAEMRAKLRGAGDEA